MHGRRYRITGLDTRVAMRTFAIFCLCAVIPIVLSAAIADRMVSSKFRAAAAASLLKASKSYGLLVFQRLQETNDLLTELADRGLSDERALQTLRDLHLRRLRIIDVRMEEQAQASTDPAQQRLANLEILRGKSAPGVTLTVSKEQAGRRIVIKALLANAYLWNGDALSTSLMRICVRTEAGRLLQCIGDAESADASRDEVLQEKWSLYLRPLYGAASWSIEAQQRTDVALADLYAFRRTLPLMTLIAVIVASLLSVVQIRRSHRPLAMLVKAATRIGRNRFDEPVTVDSKDEYQRLARAFNRMSAGLARQFVALRLLARIDRMILNDPSVSAVAQRVLPALPRLLGARSVGVALQLEHDDEFVLYIAGTTASPGFKQQCIQLRGEGLEDLQKSLRADAFHVGSRIRQEVLAAMQVDSLNTIAIQVQGKLRGLLLMHTGTSRLRATQMRRGRGYASRFAVALRSEERRHALVRQAYYDDLTGLPNRQLFKDRLQQELARAKRANAELALIFIDLDRFKNVNDSLGHSAGDELLQAVGARLASVVRDTDTLARLGGDEFVVIATELQQLPAHLLAERLQAVLQRPISVQNVPYYITASFGMTMYPQDAQGAETLLRNADIAMYKAKAAGRGRALYFEEEMNRDAQRRLALEQRLRIALRNGALHLVFQPKIDLIDGRVCGVEALARWVDDELGSVAPGVFIPIAEECGLIDELGAWALRRACETYQAWLQDGLDVGHISVNASVRQLRDRQYVQAVMDVLSDTGMRAQALELEVTESTLAQNTTEAAVLLDALRMQGVRIAIDDFGTGYSSMAAIGRLPADVIKIDRSFIEDCASRPDAASVVEAIITMAHVLGKHTVAEGVETSAQLSVLRRLGCDAVQGYLLAMPMTAAELRNFKFSLHAAEPSASAPKKHLPHTLTAE